MSKVLVIGDLIVDVYHNCKATRLCPEAPVPVLNPISRQESFGGAGLVVGQLEALIGRENIDRIFGSVSHKHRYFVDNHLVSRIDYDAENSDSSISERVTRNIAISRPDLIIISDYGKGSISSQPLALQIMSKTKGIPVFVDAKHHWDWYKVNGGVGAFAFFPNQHETCGPVTSEHVVQKLGPQGCSVDGKLVPVEDRHEVLDVTGAGDIFLAAFAAKFLTGDGLLACAKFANKVASRSVEFVGTHVVTEVKL